MTSKIETITCKNCGTSHTYERKRKHRIHCSHACASEYRDKQPKTKAARNTRQRKYYKAHPGKKCLAATKTSAKKRGLDFNLDEQWFNTRLKRGICELTGLPIRTNAGSSTGGRDFYSPSIDRIDNSIGYVPSNVRMVAWGVNLSKNKYSDRDLSALSLSIVLSHLPKASQQDLVDILPPQLTASLPSGHAFDHLQGVTL